MGREKPYGGFAPPSNRFAWIWFNIKKTFFSSKCEAYCFTFIHTAHTKILNCIYRETSSSLAPGWTLLEEEKQYFSTCYSIIAAKFNGKICTFFHVCCYPASLQLTRETVIFLKSRLIFDKEIRTYLHFLHYPFKEVNLKIRYWLLSTNLVGNAVWNPNLKMSVSTASFQHPIFQFSRQNSNWNSTRL